MDAPDAVIGGYRVLEVLKRGATSTVFLAEGEAGDRVVVKVLEGGPDPGGAAARRFVAQVESLRRVSGFCTAQVLGTGLDGDRPYVVTEYVEGPTLAGRVAAEGPLRGGELDRFAIGTMTGLVAIHEAGVVHLAFNPDNVLLAADGPRVINFGLARAIDTTLSMAGGTTRTAGGMPYLAPEQYEDGRPGPAADVFSWAATMVFAATGRPPFGDGADVVARIGQGSPQLGDMEKDLRDIVAACLVADPALRPSGDQVLHRLLDRTPGTDGAPGAAGGGARVNVAPGVPAAGGSTNGTVAEGTTVPGAAPDGRRRFAVVAGAAAVAVALALSGTVLYLNRSEPTPRQDASSSPVPVTPSAAASSASPAARATNGPVQASLKVPLPGLDATLNEDPSDPVRLTGYLAEKDLGTYLRTAKDGTFPAGFTRADEYRQPVTSPDGTHTAYITWRKFNGTTTDSVTVVDHATGNEFSLNVSEKPFGVVAPIWSRDGRKLLLTLYDFDSQGSGETDTRQGFVVVDVQTQQAYTAETGKGSDVGSFIWTPDGQQVARITGDAKEVNVYWYDLEGKQVRKSAEVGPVYARGDWFSPSGERYFTVCPGTPKSVCLWNTATGEREAAVPSGTPEDVARPVGWFDENHLILTEFRRKKNRFLVVDLDGNVRRVLTEIPGDEPMFNILLDFTPLR
ncbi:protein kinase [Thermopolyspora sp. NPDC052614]|uniref:protein kinase domain-containing protein n=1 Tax=Thermopolyspora sp. NPDC052614 TaxID=3155682 RepID=UPI00341750A3